MKEKKVFIGFPMRCRQLIGDQRGVTTIEYALIGVAMAILIIAALGKDSIFSAQMKEAFNNIGTNVNTATKSFNLSGKS